MLEDKRIEVIRIKEYITEYLFGRGISTDLQDNPRYEAILWKLSNMIRKVSPKGFSDEAKQLLGSIINIGTDGSLIIIEGAGKNNTLVSSKYYFDRNDNKLKRLRLETAPGGKVNCMTIGTYNSDGIEVSLSTEQNTLIGKYMSRATREPNRIDLIKIERFKQIKRKFEKTRGCLSN